MNTNGVRLNLAGLDDCVVAIQDLNANVAGAGPAPLEHGCVGAGRLDRQAGGTIDHGRIGEPVVDRPAAYHRPNTNPLAKSRDNHVLQVRGRDRVEVYADRRARVTRALQTEVRHPAPIRPDPGLGAAEGSTGTGVVDGRQARACAPDLRP